MDRFIVFDPNGVSYREIPRKTFRSIERVEEVNGEHALSFSTTRDVQRGERVVIVCDDGVTREYVVTREGSDHDGTTRLYRDYYAVWSLQTDLMGARITASLEDASASDAMDTVIRGFNAEPLSGQSIWRVGTVEPSGTASLDLYHIDCWEGLSEIVKAYGGEVDASVTMSGDTVTRYVSLRNRVGSMSSVRRFTWGRGLKSVSREVIDMPICCRIIPEGKTTETEGVRESVGISSVEPNGHDYIQDEDMAYRYRVMGSEGYWEFPMQYARNSEIEDPQELYDWALSVLHDYTRPKVVYDGSVYAFFGDKTAYRLRLGDTVQAIDEGFDLELEGRIMRIRTDELEPRNIDITIDNLRPTIDYIL